MAFPLHASEISDKSETGREKHVSVPAESSHFFPFNFFCTGGAKMWRFSGRMWQKTSQVKKIIFLCESVAFFPEMWQMWRVTFFVTEKSDKCDVTLPNLRREAGKKCGQDRPLNNNSKEARIPIGRTNDLMFEMQIKFAPTLPWPRDECHTSPIIGSHCRLAQWSMQMMRTLTTTPSGLSLDLYSLEGMSMNTKYWQSLLQTVWCGFLNVFGGPPMRFFLYNCLFTTKKKNPEGEVPALENPQASLRISTMETIPVGQTNVLWAGPIYN